MVLGWIIELILIMGSVIRRRSFFPSQSGKPPASGGPLKAPAATPEMTVLGMTTQKTQSMTFGRVLELRYLGELPNGVYG
jgi:hypothetical protein